MKKVFILFLVSLLVLVSCSGNKKNEKIEFDKTHPLALAPDVSWALVTDPYASFRESMNWNADTTGHIRKGEILQVIGRSVDEKKYVWYKFAEGWLPASCLTIYSNRMKAQSAANQLKD